MIQRQLSPKLLGFVRDHASHTLQALFPTAQGITDLYSGQDILDIHDRGAIAVASFGEYQHSLLGGGAFDTPETQEKFEEVRRHYPLWARTPIADSLHHGNQANHP